MHLDLCWGKLKKKLEACSKRSWKALSFAQDKDDNHSLSVELQAGAAELDEKKVKSIEINSN